MKLGKKPARHDPRDLQLEHYLTGTELPKFPPAFGHESLVSSWGMLGNDRVGDCVLAGAGHETMLWNALRGQPVDITDENSLADYSAITGYNPADPSTDQGTDVREALGYRRKTGIVDAQGRRHKIGGYVALEPGNHEHLYLALYLFGAAGIGFEFPVSAGNQFNSSQPWSVVPGAQIDGGHYVPLVARRHRRLRCVTWGRLQDMTMPFFSKYCDEAYGIFSPEFLTRGHSPEGFDRAQLLADLKALDGGAR